MGLEDYKDIVSTSAGICTIAHMLSGTLVCKDIYKKGTSKGVDPRPFIGGLGVGLLMFRYALILGDPTMITVNIVGLSVNIAYTAVYCLYTDNMKDVYSLMSKVGAGVLVLLTYAQLESSEKIEFRFGMIVTVLLFSLVAAPLLNLKEIIRTKNTDILPFPMIFMGTIVASHWLLYGIIINNSFVIFQNVVGLGLSVFQLSLFVIYPSSKKKD